jgi:hypothetical protein
MSSMNQYVHATRDLQDAAAERSAARFVSAFVISRET